VVITEQERNLSRIVWFKAQQHTSKVPPIAPMIFPTQVNLDIGVPLRSDAFALFRAQQQLIVLVVACIHILSILQQSTTKRDDNVVAPTTIIAILIVVVVVTSSRPSFQVVFIDNS
jgi:hypothetical protein